MVISNSGAAAYSGRTTWPKWLLEFDHEDVWAPRERRPTRELSCNSVSTGLVCCGLNHSVPVCGAASGCPPPELCPLNQLKAGTSARIKQLAASPEVSHRLREMGFCEEQEIRLVSRHVNVICQVCNARLGLSRQLAESILVEPLPPASRQLEPA